MPEKELINMEMAEGEVAKCIATVEQQLNSALVPGDQKLALLLARSQLYGSYAMVRIHNRLLEMDDKLDDGKTILQ